MHGFEYQFAGLLISEGKIKEGLSIVKGVRDRYDGKKRNPWNEFECGSNYARSMASFALIPIFSGFKFDLPDKMIGFATIENREEFRFFWALDSVWGTVEGKSGAIIIKIEEGRVSLDKIYIKNADKVKKLIIDGSECEFSIKDEKLSFNEKLVSESVEIYL